MKFNINGPLFKIETNDNFYTKKIEKNKLFDQVLSNFGINTKYSIYFINKKSKASKIYFVKNKKNIFVLRSSASQDSQYLKSQCKVVASLKKNFFFNILKGKYGYTFKAKNFYFILYKKVNGKIFNGKVNHLNEIFYNIVKLHKNLKKKNIFDSNLQIKKYKIRKIQNHGMLLTKKNFLNKIFSKKMIGKQTKELVTNNKFYIKNCINNIIKLKLEKKNLQIVHGDLNHSNIIVSKKRVRFIDLEDLIIDNFKIALAHGIFKVLRHVVFKNKNKLHYVNNYCINLCNNLIKKNIFSSHNEIFNFCTLRILSDISFIINSIYRGEKEYLYDFEKRILNLIELRYIFKLHELKS
uniref:Aminoglycoside phosphotransferase domain-containing protein n=1 Tax=uncultured marine bacterium 440 TaxID=257390 RepID=Q6SHB7_9BACT|nr:hypothetical protein MBMO_EBAC750-02H05.21 [uncultured marine bacterium 440]